MEDATRKFPTISTAVQESCKQGEGKYGWVGFDSSNWRYHVDVVPLTDERFKVSWVCLSDDDLGRSVTGEIIISLE